MRLNIFNPSEQKKIEVHEYKQKKGDYTLLTVGSILGIAALIAFVIYTSTKNGKCISIENQVMNEAIEYLTRTNQLPSVEGDEITINISDYNSQIMLNDKICSGTITVKKIENRYIKTFDIKDCGYCTTEKRYSWSKSQAKYPNKKQLISAELLFNYVDVSYNYTNWTDAFKSEEIDTIVSEYGIKMPLDEKKYPKVPTAGNLIAYETDIINYYSYRDAKWKFYKNKNDSYSEFSSTKPKGYIYRDDKTVMQTPLTEWSTSYPDEYSYRTISSTTGYKWYYENSKGVKVYYNDGKYTPKESLTEDLLELYNKKEKEGIKMYRYTDKQWRWYNGTARDYSGFMYNPTSIYPYKDEGVVQYSSWSGWTNASKVDSSNMHYREEKIDIRQRYRAQYTIYSNLKISNYLNYNDFVKRTGRTLKEMQNDKNVKVLIEYSYRYGK